MHPVYSYQLPVTVDMQRNRWSSFSSLQQLCLEWHWAFSHKLPPSLSLSSSLARTVVSLALPLPLSLCSTRFSQTTLLNNASLMRSTPKGFSPILGQSGTDHRERPQNALSAAARVTAWFSIQLSYHHHAFVPPPNSTGAEHGPPGWDVWRHFFAGTITNTVHSRVHRLSRTIKLCNNRLTNWW